MIKVKINVDGENTFYVEDGVTVSYNEDVLEVLDIDDSVIAVFRGWVYGLPATEEEQDLQEEELGSAVGEVAAYFETLGTASSAHVNSHGAYGLVDGAIEDPSE